MRIGETYDVRVICYGSKSPCDAICAPDPATGAWNRQPALALVQRCAGLACHEPHGNEAMRGRVLRAIPIGRGAQDSARANVVAVDEAAGRLFGSTGSPVGTDQNGDRPVAHDREPGLRSR
jgi:hypothetical protein